MRPELYQEIALTRDIPEDGLRKGDLAMLVDYIPHPGGGEEGAILEVFNALGESINVLTVPVSAIEALRENHIPTVRTLEVSARTT